MKQPYRARINQTRSPVKMAVIPAVSVLLGSLTAILPILASAPVLPPFGLMILIAWRMLRPGLWPIWVGVLFGAFDDLFSGQPFGSAILLWSVALIVLELNDTQIVWRNFWRDWLTGGMLLTLYLIGTFAISVIFAGPIPIISIAPQIILTVFLFPLIIRFVSRLDRLRYAS